MKQIARDQFIAKLQRKKRHMDSEQLHSFETKAGMNPDDFIKHLSQLSIAEVANWFIKNPDLGKLLDHKRAARRFAIPIADNADSVREIQRGYGSGEAERPQDYIEGFQKFISENTKKITALKLIVQRPRELKRKQLRELQLQLEELGYREQDLKSAKLRPILRLLRVSLVLSVKQPWEMPWFPGSREWMMRLTGFWQMVNGQSRSLDG